MKKTIATAALATILAAWLTGCASYERTEYYENGQLKLKEKTTGLFVRSK